MQGLSESKFWAIRAFRMCCNYIHITGDWRSMNKLNAKKDNKA